VPPASARFGKVDDRDKEALFCVTGAAPRSTGALGVIVLAIKFTGRVRKWVIIGAVVLLAWLGAGLLESWAARSHKHAAVVFIEDKLPLIGAGDPSKLLPLFVAGAVPEDTSATEARIRSWGVLGALKWHGSIDQVAWSWESHRSYRTEGMYRVEARYAAGHISVFWTLVTKPDGTLGIYDVAVGAPSEEQ